MDVFGPMQYINQTCYLLPANFIQGAILGFLHEGISFLSEIDMFLIVLSITQFKGPKTALILRGTKLCGSQFKNE